MCFVKYPHKKKKLNAAWAAKKKSKLSSSDKFLSKFFNNVKSIFDKTDDNVTTLSFMFVIESHLMSVWIVDTEASDHLCSTCKFFLMSLFLGLLKRLMNLLRSLKEHGFTMFSSFWQWHTRGYPQRRYACLWFLCEPCFDCACALMISLWHVWLHLTSQNNVIEYTSEVNRIFQLHLDNTPQSHAFAANCEFKVLFDMWMLEPFKSYKHCVCLRSLTA
jgi:hypothetical protein